MDWLGFIDIMMLDERAARAKYKRAARMAAEPQMQEVMTKLAYEEEVHLAVLQKFKKDLQAARTGKGGSAPTA